VLRTLSENLPESSRSVISRRTLLASLAAAFPASRLSAEEKDATFSTDVKVVSVLATIRDKQGKIVSNLGKDDFVLSEDDRPQIIRCFARETDLPLTLGLLVDTSASQRRVLGEERTASYRFLDNVLRGDKDKTFVIHFDHDTELLQDLTSSRPPLLQKVLDQLELPADQRPQWTRRGGGGSNQGGGGGGRRAGTTLYDAIYLASDDLMKKQQGRKALILMTDGVDNGSKTYLNDASGCLSQQPGTPGASVHISWKRISTLTRTATGSPSFLAGSKRHCLTASTAFWSTALSRDLITCTFLGSPRELTTTAIRTVPAIRKPSAGCSGLT
jgi:hypothetical protein